MVQEFRDELRRQSISKSSRVCLLHEAATKFDSETGELIDGTDVEDVDEKEDDKQDEDNDH